MQPSTYSHGREGRLHITAMPRFSTVSAMDFTYRVLGIGVGTLDASLPDGIYEIVARAGGRPIRQLVRVRADRTTSQELKCDDAPSLMPLPGSTSWNTEAAAAIEELSLRPSASRDGDSALVLALRIDDERRSPLPVVSLQTDTGFKLGTPDHEWKAGRGWRAWSGLSRSGGYLAQVFAPEARGRRRARDLETTTFPLWLAPGWQTICFLDVGAGNSSVTMNSTHLSRIGVRWNSSARATMEFEAALQAARIGVRMPLSRDELTVANLDSSNPMVGILDANVIMKDPRPDYEALGDVLNYLDGEISGHPDVAALRVAAQHRLRRYGTPEERLNLDFNPPGSVSWPPSIAASYAGVIEVDAGVPETVAIESLADRFCANRVRDGLWTRFRTAPWGVSALKGEAEELSRLGIEGLRISPEAPLESRIVAEFLGRFARVHKLRRADEIQSNISVGTIAWSTSLTTAAVRRALYDTTTGTDWSDRPDLHGGGPGAQREFDDDAEVAVEREKDLVPA